MSSRHDILQAIRQNRPPPEPIPEVPVFTSPPADLAGAFVQALEAVGGRVLEAGAEEPEAAIAAAFPGLERVASMVPDVPGSVSLANVDDPHALATLDLFVCRGTLGVAENGAVWIPESHLGHRAALFLAEHVALLLDRRALVADLHQAYARLRTDAEPFGVFVSGPSKTADIEQALVIGAHGPRSLTILLRDEG